MNLLTWWRNRRTLAICSPYQRHLVALCNAYRARIGAPLLTRI